MINDITRTIGIDNLFSIGAAVNSTVASAYYSPSPDKKYQLTWCLAPDLLDFDGPHKFSLTWMQSGNGGITVIHPIGAFCHYTYVSEKLRIDEEDAKVLAHFMNSINCYNYNPADFSDDILPQGVKDAISEEIQAHGN
ncbi:hypothetical protein CMI37_18050 [Candidatus Pacearchaeota archaeon]|nr:hypothetical protein [Candidatus Pacearchaeota archaeon]|tara:strand:- start:224 stop:637 length:414 start_codon:yes stop_codon:yes gene_type:complete